MAHIVASTCGWTVLLMALAILFLVVGVPLLILLGDPVFAAMRDLATSLK